MNSSQAELLASLSESERAEALAGITDPEAAALLYDWRFWARPEQMQPAGDWTTWMVLAGRGAGKTRTGAEFVRQMVAGGARRIALVAPTAGDARTVMMEGESGLLSIYPPHQRPEYYPTRREVHFHNGAQATTYSAEEPERLRGPQHDCFWCDEAAAWKYPEATWDNLMFGLRLGNAPRGIVSTTPKPIPLIRRLVQDPTTHVTRGSTYDNRGNLPRKFFDAIIKRYEGTRLGRQELLAELLEDTPGALWRQKMIDDSRVLNIPAPLVRIVVAIDPAVSNTEESDETGLVAAGLGPDGHAYVLEDASAQDTPHGWASRAVALLRKLRGDRIVAEVNNGGDLVEYTVRTIDQNAPYRALHASRGKEVRAEPVAALYEQRRVHHVGTFGLLESQMCTWVPGQKQKSPDRMDALVWAITDLMIDQEELSVRVVYDQPYVISPY